MTDYCEVSDIEAWFPGIKFSSETKATLTWVGNLISRHSATIDGRLYAKYTVPITGSTALAIVQEICEFLVIADVDEVMNTGIGRGTETSPAVDYRDLANKKLDKLESGELVLIDGSTSTSNDFANYNEDNSIDPIIERDKTQW